MDGSGALREEVLDTREPSWSFVIELTEIESVQVEGDAHSAENSPDLILSPRSSPGLFSADSVNGASRLFCDASARQIYRSSADFGRLCTGALRLRRRFRGGLGLKGTILGTGASVIAFWAATEMRDGTRQEPLTGWIEFVERFCLGTGVNLLLHAVLTVLTYALYVRRTPFLVVAGGLASAALLTLRRASPPNVQAPGAVLLIGFDSVARKIYHLLREPVVGVVSAQPELLPAGARFLGGQQDAEAVLKEYRPPTSSSR